MINAQTRHLKLLRCRSRAMPTIVCRARFQAIIRLRIVSAPSLGWNWQSLVMVRRYQLRSEMGTLLSASQATRNIGGGGVFVSAMMVVADVALLFSITRRVSSLKGCHDTHDHLRFCACKRLRKSVLTEFSNRFILHKPSVTGNVNRYLFVSQKRLPPSRLAGSRANIAQQRLQTTLKQFQYGCAICFNRVAGSYTLQSDSILRLLINEMITKFAFYDMAII